jgi:hypothetical protein
MWILILLKNVIYAAYVPVSPQLCLHQATYYCVEKGRRLL